VTGILYAARVRSRILAVALSASVIFACSEKPDAPAAHDEAVSSESSQAQPVAARPESQPRGRPLPAFSGWTLDDERLEISSLLGKRLLIYFFNPEVKNAALVSQAVNGIAGLQGDHNFAILGVATGSNKQTAERFVREHGIGYAVLDDSSATIANRMGVRTPIAMLGVDADGFVVFGVGQIDTHGPQAVRVIEANLRQALRLPELAGESTLGGGNHPKAPTFRAEVLDAEQPFDLAAQRGRSVVLIFFLHTCSHCHETLAFLKENLATIPADRRPTLVGVEISGRSGSVRQQLKDLDLDFFPVVFDEDGSIQANYNVFAGVPDTFLIDAKGRIRARVRGWRGESDGPLLRMRLAKLAGAPVPMLLRRKGYSGNDACGVCHELEHETWTFTTHANAFDTLVKHTVETDAECVSCHVVGYGQPGGFVSATSTPELEDVGCESCHGRGGPHLSPGFVQEGNYESACKTCHDAKHSLGFDYATFAPRISHAANAHIAALPPAEKRKLLAERGRPGGDLLATGADFVGSEACRACHAAEFATWAAAPHARAVNTLEKKGKAGDADCLRCHTTGFGRSGGFSSDASSDAHADLARVGCESCHGPGGEHVKEGVAKLGSIVSLGDKCDSCVILQICGSCHDDANDPGFEFEVLDKIEKQRHGTIEAGTGKPKPTSASLQDAQLLGAHWLAPAFASSAPGR
jgi:peroxiredoxin